MKNSFNLITIVLVIITYTLAPAIQAQDAIQKEISASLEAWNNNAKNRDLDKFMSLFDDAPDIMLVGSDSGEVFKGKQQIEDWLKMLFGFASFSWDMNRIDIDHYQNTAWVFMEGYMVVTFDSGKTRRTTYRFTGVLVKQKNEWKWRLFNGSVPGGE
jgi:ketosteroid isomerase-like protein